MTQKDSAMIESQFSKVPHLRTSLSGPLAQLERDLLDSQVKIECWLRDQWHKTPASIYSSVDLRNAGYKLAPVDTNLFSAGFNNLNPDFIPLCVQAIQTTMEQLCPNISKVLLIPEDQSKNLFYYDNLAMIQDVLQKAGFEVRIATLLPHIKEAKTIETPSGSSVTLEPITRVDNELLVGDFKADLVLLNNDLSGGVPEILENISQKILPPTKMGWSTRLKSGHFQHMQNVATEFANEFGLDAWHFAPLFRYCGEVNFATREGENCLVRHTETLFKAIKAKYKEYNVKDDPFVVIKADAGTYGMAVMTIKDPEEIRSLNKKQRSKMTSSKGGQAVTSVIVQEGVYTYETIGKEKAVAEPVVYMIGRHVVGGFYRVHQARGKDENLNAPGMNFEPLAFAEVGSCPGKTQEDNRFYSYGVIARLAALAAAREIKESMTHD